MIRKDSIDLLEATENTGLPTLSDRLELARRCQAIVPMNWPDGGLAEAVGHTSAADGQVGQGWRHWYALARDASAAGSTPVVVGGGAVLLLPTSTVVRMVFRLLPQFQGHRYGESIAGGLVDWVFGHTHAARISVTVPWSDAARVHILAKMGFVVLDGDAGFRTMAEFVLRRGEAGFGPKPVP